MNSYIPCNTLLGKQRQQTLPKADDVVAFIDTQKNEYWLTSTDLKNAYKHFKCCPSNFTLYMIKWKSKFYLESSITFGSRNSSLHMHTVSNTILDILNTKGI